MATIVMSDAYPPFCNALRQLGHTVIPTDTVSILPKPEQCHADLQVLKIEDKLFALSECANLRERLAAYQPTIVSGVGKNYPHNIVLNFLYHNSRIYGRTDCMAAALTQFCKKRRMTPVFMKQGYARCTTLVLNDSAAVTADDGVYQTLTRNGAEVLKIQGDGIRLDGYDKGFIGGASCVIANTVYFFGNAAVLKDYSQITGFCGKYGFSVQNICPGIPLTDIGGAVVL